MGWVVIAYVVLLLAVLVYVGVLVYHIFRFRIKDEKDKSGIALVIYIITIGAILLVTIIGAIIAYNI